MGADPKLASNWITSVILGYLNKMDVDIDDIYLTPDMLFKLMQKVSSGEISIKQGKEVLFKALNDQKDPIRIVEESGMKQIGAEDTILKFVLEVLDEQPASIEQYKLGRVNVVDFLVGQVMKKTQGQANPAITRNMVIEEIGKR